VNLLRRHLEAYRRLGPWPFCLCLTVEATLVSLAVATLTDPILPDHERTFLLKPWPELVLPVIVLAPPLETLLFQAIPITFLRFLRVRERNQIIVSATAFALAHISEGAGAFLAAGVVGGLYFAFSYAHWARTRHRTAFWVTALNHATRNAMAVSAMAVFGTGS
jgi:membrane protease YdiL (CAAX protease family)